MSEPYIYIVVLLLVEALIYLVVRVKRSLRETLSRHGVNVDFLTVMIDLGNASRLHKVASFGRKPVRYVIFIAGIFNMAFLVAYLYLILASSLKGIFAAISSGGTPTSPFVPVIPGVTVGVDMLIPLLLSIGVAVGAHELMHAIVAFIEGVKIDSWGVGIFAIFPVAYVRPSETSFNEVPRRSRISVLSAGILGNSLLTLLCVGFIGILSQQVIVVPVIIDLDRSNPTLPAVQTNISTPSIILEVNGTKISSLNAFTSLLSEFYNHSLIIELKVEKCIVEGYKAVGTGIIDNYAMYKPAGSKLGVYLRELISSTTPDHVITTLTYLNWVFVVNFSLALINAAPLFITDGGRIVSEMLSRVSMKVNYLVQAVTSVAIVILLLIGLASYI